VSAPDLLEEILEAHGGRTRWELVETISFDLRTGGLLPRTRFPGGGFADAHVTVNPRERTGVSGPFPGRGRRGVFEDGTVRIETDSGTVLDSRADPRSDFFGLAGLRRNLRWDPLDATYFAGYALWGYLSFPWILTGSGFEIRRGRDWAVGPDETWRALEVRFPAGLDAHCAEQIFWIGPDGLLRRNDYTVEVIGRWARAAHRCERYAEAGGLLFPTRRRVYPRPRNLRALPGPVLVALDLDRIEVRFAPDAGGAG